MCMPFGSAPPGCLHVADASPLKVSSEAQVSVPGPCTHSGCGSWKGREVVSAVCAGLSVFCWLQTICCVFLWAFEALFLLAALFMRERASQGKGTFPLSQLLPRDTGHALIFFFFFFCLNSVTWRPFLQFWLSEIYQHSVDILWGFFHM